MIQLGGCYSKMLTLAQRCSGNFIDLYIKSKENLFSIRLEITRGDSVVVGKRRSFLFYLFQACSKKKRARAGKGALAGAQREAMRDFRSASSQEKRERKKENSLSQVQGSAMFDSDG